MLAQELGGDDRVGDYLDSVAEDDVAWTLAFAALDRGYAGWRWSVTLAVVPGFEPTVSEVVLLPGPDALIAPSWVPWAERARGDDLGPGDLWPAEPDDPRLVPGYVQSDDPQVEALAEQLGLGRIRVLSREGREDAADRWHDGPFGPDTDMARSAPGHCGSCGFYLPLGGALGAGFGACGNERSPADGRVVDVVFGCGAHSDVRVDTTWDTGASIVDEVRLEIHPHPAI